MSEMSSSLIAPFDPELGGVLLANMLDAWLDAQPDFLTIAEVTDELEDHRAASEQTRLHLPAPIDPGSSSSSSGEHRTPVCPAAEGTGVGLERSHSPHTGSRFGNIRYADNQTHGFQDFGGGCFDGSSGAVFALEVSRLARSNADWYRLLELCALTQTLVIDEDGCYDPADFNDGLLLG